MTVVILGIGRCVEETIGLTVVEEKKLESHRREPSQLMEKYIDDREGREMRGELVLRKL